MKPSVQTAGNLCAGFTLLEIILTIIVSSILGTILYSYFSVMLHGNDSPAKLRRMYDLQTVMEKITAHYDEIAGKNTAEKWAAGKPYAVGDKTVSRSEPYGHLYICTVAGISDSTEPAWPTDSDASVTDGTVTWKEDGGELDVLLEKLSAPVPPSPDAVWDYGYGRYGIVSYGFIRFDGGTEIPAPAGSAQNLLKVSIRNEDGYTLTALFSSTY